MTLHQYLIWTDASGSRYVPGWAPDRIISLAVLRHPSAKIVTDKPAGALCWHPALDD